MTEADRQRDEKTAGIIGGMGPEATVCFMLRVIRATPASDDCDHVRMIVDNDPKIPSRIKAVIEGGEEDPAGYLADMGKRLEQWGADFLAIPCNTAHYYYPRIRDAVNIPVLNMIELTVEHVQAEKPDMKSIGVLASPAVFRTGLFQSGFGSKGVEILAPLADEQEDVLLAIRRIKAGDTGPEVVNLVRRAAAGMEDRGADALLVACTEISAINERLEAGVKIYDSCDILADSVVRRAKRL